MEVPPKYEGKKYIRNYDNLYKGDYMESWRSGKLHRISRLLRSAGLAEKGRALDFGCGAGVFTSLLKAILPGWEISGCDISPVAVDKASAEISGCRFFTLDYKSISSHENSFDLIFSHHVLEHVTDLKVAFEAINRMLRRQAFMIHILPCGNEGSLEYRLASARKDGILKQKNNLFFFEAPLHLRRLCSRDLAGICEPNGFLIAGEYYANQHWGAINWISGENIHFITEIADPEKVESPGMKHSITVIRKKLLFYRKWKNFRALKYNDIENANKSFYYRIYFIALKILSAVFTEYLKLRSSLEWKYNKHDPRGSEMYMVFKRADH